MPMNRYHIISAPLCSPLRSIINRAVMHMIKKCRWYDGDPGGVHYDNPDVAPNTLHQTRCTDTPEPTRVGAIIDEGSPETYICCYIMGYPHDGWVDEWRLSRTPVWPFGVSGNLRRHGT
jgi:hypothetical protein